MLEEHSNKDMLLAETVKETILKTSHESIPKYIDSGIRQLNEKADEYMEMLDWNRKDWSVNVSKNFLKKSFFHSNILSFWVKL